MIEAAKSLADRPGTAGCAAPGYDPLTLILDGIRLGGATCFSLEHRGSWACQTPPPDEHPRSLRFAQQQVVLFHLVTSGAGTCEAMGESFQIAENDLLIFPFGDPHILRSGDQAVDAVRVLHALPPAPWPLTPRFALGEGAMTLRFICGVLYFEGLAFNPLFESLPRVLRLRHDAADRTGWLSSSLDLIRREFEEPEAGGFSMSKRLAEILFIALMRQEMAKAPGDRTGWLAAIADPRVGRALAHLHTAPAEPWTVATLAKACATSRSRLAEEFRVLLGMGPMEFLLHWRMELARRELVAGRSVTETAFAAGYGSEPAFSRAFKRVFGVSPRTLRSRQTS